MSFRCRFCVFSFAAVVTFWLFCFVFSCIFSFAFLVLFLCSCDFFFNVVFGYLLLWCALTGHRRFHCNQDRPWNSSQVINRGIIKTCVVVPCNLYMITFVTFKQESAKTTQILAYVFVHMFCYLKSWIHHTLTPYYLLLLTFALHCQCLFLAFKRSSLCLSLKGRCPHSKNAKQLTDSELIGLDLKVGQQICAVALFIFMGLKFIRLLQLQMYFCVNYEKACRALAWFMNP